MTAIAIHASFQFLAFPIQWNTQATVQNGNIASRVIICHLFSHISYMYNVEAAVTICFHLIREHKQITRSCSTLEEGPLTALLNWAA